MLRPVLQLKIQSFWGEATRIQAVFLFDRPASLERQDHRGNGLRLFYGTFQHGAFLKYHTRVTFEGDQSHRHFLPILDLER